MDSFQQRNINGTWGPLFINDKQVDYEGYPHRPAPITIEKMKMHSLYDHWANKENPSNSYSKVAKPITQCSVSNSTEHKIECTAHEDCNGNTYYQRGYYINLPNGGFKWVDCGSSYNIHKEN